MSGPAARPALEQIRQSADALLADGKIEETRDFFLAALEAVLASHRDLGLLVLKLRPAWLGRHTRAPRPAASSTAPLSESFSQYSTGPDLSTCPRMDSSP